MNILAANDISLTQLSEVQGNAHLVQGNPVLDPIAKRLKTDASIILEIQEKLFCICFTGYKTTIPILQL